MRVAYEDNPTIGFRVTLIHSWRRSDIEAPVMSASSGPKDYAKNHIWSIFDRFPNVARVLMVRGEYSGIGKDQHLSPPFLLVADAAGKVFDMAGKPVLMEE